MPAARTRRPNGTRRLRQRRAMYRPAAMRAQCKEARHECEHEGLAAHHRWNPYGDLRIRYLAHAGWDAYRHHDARGCGLSHRRHRRHRRIRADAQIHADAGWTVLYAVLDILIGILMLAHPVVLAGLIPWLVGFGILVFGAFEAYAAVRARTLPGAPWGWMLFSAIVDIVCGISFIAFPAMLSLFVALFVIMRGATLIVFGIVGRRGLMM